MDISRHIKEFAGKNHRYKPYSKICRKMLLGGMPYSLNSQKGYEESEYLPYNIRSCVQAYASTKDTAIELFKDLVLYLEAESVDVPQIDFPPIPVSNTFERLMFIAKYLQEKENRISELTDILWVNPRTIEDDLSRLRGINDPIQVCGKAFYIPDTVRQDGRITFQSTAHPIFLAENLTQVLIILKGLKEMSGNPMFRPYAMQSAREIWEQLSSYAKERICYVLRDLLPEDYGWYESLSVTNDNNHFHSEEEVSRNNRVRSNVVLDCIKNGKPFCVEYLDEDGIHFYKDCVMEEGSYRSSEPGIMVKCSEGQVRLHLDKIIRSTYTVEELVSD